ncbi:MAG: S8 family peptidase [Calditrichota bacterium]
MDRLLDAAALGLTERSLERRRKNIPREPPLRPCDLPPDPLRITALKAQGLQIVCLARYLNAVSVRGSPEALQKAAQLSFVDSIQLVKAYAKMREEDQETTFIDSPPLKLELNHQICQPELYGDSWRQNALINLPAAHELIGRGQGVLIGVQDAGFDNLGHRCFDYLHVVAAWDFVNNDGNVADEGDQGSGSHGTRTLSVIAGLDSGRFIGAAPEARFVLTKTENSDWERPVEEDYWVAGLWFHDSLGVDVLSSSVSYRAWYAYDELDGRTAVTSRAADSAAAAGMVIVNSMGNTGRDAWPLNKMGAPADAFRVISVGGVTSDSSRWTSSSQGPTADGRVKPDVTALSSGVYTAVNYGVTDYFPRSGTSFSCPLIAGVAALIIQANPELTPLQVLDILHQTSNQADHPDTLMGWGIVDALAAVRRAREMSVRYDNRPIVDSGFRIYPNPTNGWVFLEGSDLRRPTVVYLYDNSGRRIESFAPQGLGHLSLTHLSGGIYWLKWERSGMVGWNRIVLIK